MPFFVNPRAEKKTKSIDELILTLSFFPPNMKVAQKKAPLSSI